VKGPPLRSVDRLIRSLRIRQVSRFLPEGARVLDVGCHDGALFARYADRISLGVGVDPSLMASSRRGQFRFYADAFPSRRLRDEQFDVITLLAVLEHVETDDLVAWRDACARLLEPGGVIVATVPSPQVDNILQTLMKLHVIDGMSVHEHHGLDPADVPAVFDGATLSLIARRRFELRLNNLYVFRRNLA